jgi:hypothetical protein
MKRLTLVLNGKGGVGKSLFAVNLVQFLKDRGIPHVAIDTDNENSTLTRYHPTARFIDLDQPRQLDGLFEAVEASGLVVVDGRAASTDLLLDYFDEIRLPEVLTELGASLTLAIPINHEADSVDQVQRLTERLGAVCRYVIVRNTAHGDSFAIYDGSEVRARLAGELTGREITLPRPQDWLVEGLNRTNLNVTAAVRHPAFHLLDRQRLLNWQRRVYAAIESAGDLLLPGAAAEEKAASKPGGSRA